MSFTTYSHVSNNAAAPSSSHPTTTNMEIWSPVCYTATGTPFWKLRVDQEVETGWIMPILAGQMHPASLDMWVQEMRFSNFQFPRSSFDDLPEYLAASCGAGIQLAPLDKNPDKVVVREITVKIPLGLCWQQQIGANLVDWVEATTGYRYSIHCETCCPEVKRPRMRRRRSPAKKQGVTKTKRQHCESRDEAGPSNKVTVADEMPLEGTRGADHAVPLNEFTESTTEQSVVPDSDVIAGEASLSAYDQVFDQYVNDVPIECQITAPEHPEGTEDGYVDFTLGNDPSEQELADMLNMAITEEDFQ